MKKIITFLLLALSLSSFANDYYEFCTEYLYLDYKNGLGFSAPILRKDTIIISIDDERIYIKGLEKFDIVDFTIKESPREDVIKFECYDSNGVKCLVKFINLPKYTWIEIAYTYFVYKYGILK